MALPGCCLQAGAADSDRRAGGGPQVRAPSHPPHSEPLSPRCVQIPNFLGLTPYFLPPSGLLENSQFQDAAKRCLDEPIPYFSQFRCKEPADGGQRTTAPSRGSASPDRYTEENGEREEMKQESSPSNEFLESWERLSEVFHHQQLREQKEMLSR